MGFPATVSMRIAGNVRCSQQPPARHEDVMSAKHGHENNKS